MSHKTFLHSSILFFAMFTLSSCTLLPSNNVLPDGVETRLFIGECREDRVKKLPLSNEVSEANNESFLGSPIATSIANSLLNQGITAVSNHLKKLAEDDVKKTVLRENIGYFQNQEAPMCIRVVRGSFKETNGDVFSNGKENINIEFIYIYSLNKNYYFMQPITTLYKGHLPQESAAGDPRQLRIEIKHINTDANNAEPDISVFDFEDEKLTNKKVYISDDGYLNGRFQTNWKPVSHRNVPHTIEVTILETKKGSTFAKILSQSFEDSKETIKTEISKNKPFITDTEALTHNISTETEKLNSLREYYEAENTAKIAIDKYIKACKCSNNSGVTPVLINLGRVAELSQRAANLAGKKLGIIAFPENEILTETGCAGMDTTGGENCENSN